MKDDHRFSFNNGFLGDALRNLQAEYLNDAVPKSAEKPKTDVGKPAHSDKKSDYVTARPAGLMEDYHPGDIVLSTYLVESEAIRGGMGAVWRVKHTGWNMDLAMKRPKSEAFQRQDQKDNFTSECRHWINLGLHPNIVSCYYVREIEEIPTIFSEWMENGSLENHINKGTLYKGTYDEVQERLLDIAIQFARGLHYAHENHLIHQDVKPDNVLLANDWTAKVSDFGLARAKTMLTFLEGDATVPEYDSDMTVVAPSGGRTPAYCSPEQAAAQPLTRQTDIYSWGVSIMEMYLGRKPWAHSGQMTGPLAGLACRDYFDMCTDRPIPKALQALLAQCMEQNPTLRPDNFSIVESELLKIYRNITGTDYPRPEPKAAPDTPDSLNNKALSYLDIGLAEEAMNCWQMANDKDPTHAVSIYNSTLYMWRNGEIDDLTAIRLIKSELIDKDHRYLAARFELERGNGEFEKDGVCEDDINAADLLHVLDKQIYDLKNISLDKKPCMEISPDGKRILVGEDGASLFSLTEKRKLWTNLNMVLNKGTAVNWEKDEICSTRRPANDNSGFQGIAVDHTLYLYRLHNGRMKTKVDINGYPESCAYKNDREIYITSSHVGRDSYNMNLVDLTTKRTLKEKAVHIQHFTFAEDIDIQFCRDGSFVLFYWRPTERGEITYYDGGNWDPVNRIDLDGEVYSHFLGVKGDRIWCLSGNIYLYELKTGDVQLRYKAPGFIEDFTLCGEDILITTQDGYLKFIELNTGRVLRSISAGGRCYSGTLKIVDGRILCLLAKNGNYQEALFTANIPKFGYKAKWELSKIQTSSWRIDLENRFSKIINEAEEAVRNNDLRKAELLVKKATELDASMQNDSRAKRLLHEIQSRKIKCALNRAVLIRAVGANAKQISFSEDSKELYIIEANDTGSIVNLDTGERLYGLEKTRCLPFVYHRKEKKRAFVDAVLKKKYGQIRLESDADENENYAAAIDIKEMGSPPVCTLRLGSKRADYREWSTDLELFYTTEDTLHFLSDGQTLLMTRRMAHASTKYLIVRFSFWNVPEHKLMKEFDIQCGILGNYFKFYVAPDEKAALIEYEVADGSRDPYNRRPKYENCLVDFRTGKKSKALSKEPAKLKGDYDFILSNKLRFTGIERQIVYIKDPYTVALTPLHQGEKEIEVVNDFRIPSDIAVSSDGLFLAVAGGEGQDIVYIYQLEWDLRYSE